MDYGAIVSQKGYDVKTCADRFLVYSSAFRSLKIANTYAVTTTIPASGENVITITHNLEYLAPVIVIYNGSTTKGVLKSYFMTDTASSLEVRVYTDKIEIHIPEFFDTGYSVHGDTVYFTVYSFLDTFDDYSASNINSGLTSGASSADYGFRMSKPGFDVKTADDIDCIISSSYSTNIIHKKGMDTTGSVSHDLGYIPSFLGFYKVSGNSFLSLTDASGYTGTMSVTTTVLTSSLESGDEFYYVIFKKKSI